MPGIILEGGTFRPIFSAGVMDALLDEDWRTPGDVRQRSRAASW